MLEAEKIDFTPETSPLLNLDGAVAGAGIDRFVAAHYGQPSQEQRALAQGRALVDLSHYGVVTITGPERLSWLHILITQQVDTLAPGESTEAFFLDLRGRIDFGIKIIDDGETTWLITEPTLNASVASWLQKMQFAARVEIIDRTQDLAVLGSVEPIPGFDGVVWSDPWPNIGPGGYPYSMDTDPQAHPGADFQWHLSILPISQLADFQLPDGWRWAGTMASEALRIEAGRPRELMDTDERTIPHELDWLRTAVHLNKGCYKGQETVARVHNLGHPPRRVVLLMIDGSVHGLPEVGADIILRPENSDTQDPALAKARSLGTLTSVAQHHEMGAIGLAVIKRNVDPEAELLIRETDPDGAETPPAYTAASQEVLTSPTAGNTVGRPQGLTNLRRGNR